MVVIWILVGGTERAACIYYPRTLPYVAPIEYRPAAALVPAVPVPALLVCVLGIAALAAQRLKL